MCNIGRIKQVVKDEAGPIIAPFFTTTKKIAIEKVIEPFKEYVYVRRIQRMADKNDKR